MKPVHANYATEIADAKQRYADYGDEDPFPGIEPALLNSEDIADYVRLTGLLCPFNPTTDKLKPASYEIDLDGDAYFWPPDRKAGAPSHEEIGGSKGKRELRLPPNSIYFFCPSTTFQIPSYIALRFDLRIQHVHRGLLLGTGPLVDPGFCGRLLIPLHNLTSSEYVIPAGEGLIWVEFTKVSPVRAKARVPGSTPPSIERTGPYHIFDEKRKWLGPEKYLAKASPHGVIQSSILNLANQVNIFEETINKYKTIGKWAAVISIFAIFLPVLTLTLSANKYVRDSAKDMDVYQKATEDKIRYFEDKTKALEERLLKLEKPESDRVSSRPKLSGEKNIAIKNK